MDKISYAEIRNNPKKVGDDIRVYYPELKLNMEMIYKFCCGVKHFQENPSILDVITTSTIIDAIIDNWNKGFADLFFKKSNINPAKLIFIKKVRNALAHGQANYFSKKDLELSKQYCDEILGL